MNKIIQIVACFLLVCLNFTGFSQEDSLMNYLEIAAKNNPGVLQKFNEYQAALEKVPQAGSLQDPELNIGIFLSPMELVGGNQVADIRLMQMFPWFGTLKAAKDEMSLMAKAKYENFKDAKLQLFYNIQRSWFELLKVKEDIRVSDRNLEILKSLERLSLIKFKAGTSIGSSATPSVGMSNNNQGNTGASSVMSSMGAGNGNNSSVSSSNASMGSNSMAASSGGSSLADLYRIQIEIAELENNIALLRNQENTLIARFNSYLNRPAKATVFLPDTLVAASFSLSLESVADSMLANNPMINMYAYEKQSSEARKKMVSRMSYPMVGLGVNYSVIKKNEMSGSPMNGEDMIMPMVTVTLPIYRKKYKAMRNEAEYLRTSAEYGAKETVNNLQAEYYEAMQLFNDAERRTQLYNNQSLLAKKSLDLVIRSFSVSGSGLTDILRVRQQLLEYETKKIEAIADYNTAIAWLKRLGGI